MFGKSAVDRLLFADDQDIPLNSESSLQTVVFSLHHICKDFGLQISILKNKVIDFYRAYVTRAKIVVQGQQYCPGRQLFCPGRVLFWRRTTVLNIGNVLCLIDSDVGLSYISSTMCVGPSGKV